MPNCNIGFYSFKLSMLYFDNIITASLLNQLLNMEFYYKRIVLGVVQQVISEEYLFLTKNLRHQTFVY